jgi:NADPH:quinone reductase-like Zn-dependent oxidoreductase
MSDVVAPTPGPDQVRVRVHATAVNRADLLQRAGMYPAPAGVPRDVPGLEYAGVVDAVGADARRWKAGDRVMGLVGGGAYAEYIVTHEDEAVRIPAAQRNRLFAGPG